MAGELVDIADEVAAAITAGTYSQEVTATRRYVETTRKEQLRELKVEVVPQTTTRERAARHAWTRKCTVLVGLQKLLSPATKQAEADELMSLADEVSERLELFEFTHGALESIDELASWSRDRYDEQSVFTRAILLTFQMKAVNHA